MFLDGPDAKARDAVHILFTGEKVRDDYLTALSTMNDVELAESFPVVSLETLVRMKLTSYLDKDRMHLRDLIDVGMIDESWPAKYLPELTNRLQQLLDTSDG